MRQEVILVDEFDRSVGSEEKIKAHEDGLLHRAFSVFVVNNKDELLLQKRADSKYHSPAYGQIPVALTLPLAKSFRDLQKKD